MDKPVCLYINQELNTYCNIFYYPLAKEKDESLNFINLYEGIIYNNS